MNWTGASERSAKAWLGGSSLPSADHLIALMASSDEIFETVLRLAGRGTAVAAQDLRDRTLAPGAGNGHFGPPGHRRFQSTE